MTRRAIERIRLYAGAGIAVTGAALAAGHLAALIAG